VGDARTERWNVVERHGWLVFLALGILLIFFGATDLTEVASYDLKVSSMSGLVVGILGAAISVTALREGARWAWLTMFVWPFYGLSDVFFRLSRPGTTADLTITFELVVFVFVPLLTLAFSGRRYLRAGS
jgi:uncharacterized membrane protein HdeD (DUF308 family)